MIGSILSNRYRLLRDLGTGGMAKVYLAEDINENKLVAVKVLHAQFGEDVAYIQRFKREAKLASLLDSPHIVKILDYGSSRDTHFLVMEYVQGQNLREQLNKWGAMVWQDALNIIDQVCAALENAHQHNIVHRDIKPQNIMLADDGMVKVLDFGIARARLLPSLTQSGFVGSPYYIAPEQAMSEEVDIRSDLYSSGIVLYELITGKVPFDSKSPWSIISKHIVSEFPAIELDDIDLPESVETLVHRLAAKRPADRFQTPTDVRTAIADVLAGHPLEKHEPAELAETAAPSLIKDLFQRAEEAIQSEDWPQAVNLLTQTLSLKPDYPEASEKLEFAGTHARLEALHQAAVQAMENSQWQDAVDLLTEIFEHDAEYKDSATLMRRAKEALENPPQPPDSTPAKNPTPEHTADASPFWAKIPTGALAATLAIVIVIVAAVILVSQNNVRPQTTPQTPPEQLLAQAKRAFNNGDTPTALSLLEEIFAQDPENAGAASLKATVTANTQYQQQLSGAIESIAAKNWTSAITQLTALHDDAPTFQPETVTNLLCDSYLNRGNEVLSHTIAPNDVATVQAARVDFEAGTSLCPTREDLKTAVSFAQSFISIQKEGVSPAEIVASLTPIIKTKPNYARGQAAIALYQAYLAQGDAEQAAGNTEAALEAFTAAINLNLDDISVAQKKQTEMLTQLAQATPTATIPPTATPSSTTEASTPPTATASNGLKYGTPVLLSPEPEAVFSGQYDEIILSWQPVGALAADEFYDVTIRYFVGDEPRYWGSGLIKDTSWKVPVEAGYGKAGKDEFWWWVTVRQGGTAQNGQPDIALSPSSEERIFIWRP